MPEHLTDAIVKRLPTPETGSKITYDDGEPKGFGCRITAAGAKSFIFNYRTKSGRERRVTIGSAANWRTTAAREEAKRLRRLVDQGGDPLGDLEDLRAAPTVSDLITRFKLEHLPRRRLSTAGDYGRMLDNHIGPALRHLKVADVAFTDIDALHRKITDTGSPYAANRCVAVLSKMFSLAVRWRMRSDNPCKGVEKNQEAKRKRYLSGDELVRLTKALAEHPDKQTANIVRLLLLTGARRGEVLAMRWADVDLGTGVWTNRAQPPNRKPITPCRCPRRFGHCCRISPSSTRASIRRSRSASSFFPASVTPATWSRLKRLGAPS